MVESFKKRILSNWMESSEGYRVGSRGLATLIYEDTQVTLQISGDVLVDPYGFRVEVGSIPKDLHISRAEIASRLFRALAAEGLVVEFFIGSRQVELGEVE
jgi:hypothetical protein